MQLRSPDKVMRLARMGAAFPTRLSFMRSLVRRMWREDWQFSIRRFDLDPEGYGTAVLSVETPARTYSLIVFSHALDPAMRTDRVIAEAWDCTFNLFDGVPDEADIARLSGNTPKQEAGRFRPSELVLARANKSVRLFQHVADSLAQGRQPDMNRLAEVGYLMRTTAVYGNGKFGIADRYRIADRPEAGGSFQIEMLAVYLYRWFTLELVQHVARARGGDRAVPLDPQIAAYLGIGNATGLGMAPFLVRHQALLHRWVTARETALARVLAQTTTTQDVAGQFMDGLAQARAHADEWQVEDAQQMARIERLRHDLQKLRRCAVAVLPDTASPWATLSAYAEAHCSTEGQEMLVSLMLEPHGDLVDDLAENLQTEEVLALDTAMTMADLADLIDRNYGWALDFDFTAPDQSERFWYYSEEKLEPRLGNRFTEPGADLEMPLAVARDVTALRIDLERRAPSDKVADLLLAHPQHRQIVTRVQLSSDHAYGEIRDNLIAADMRPIDILRFKLALFGACRFDPKSDLWTRISMYQGAPLPGQLTAESIEGWSLAVRPGAT